MERLQKILSRAGIASRRRSEELIVNGRATVNGVTVRELGPRANAALDDVRVDGRRVQIPEHHRYILVNKPRGYVTTRSDPERRRTVLDLVRGVSEDSYPVGRLDYESGGLVLLTNDGDLAARLTHPRHGVPRVYEVQVLGVPDAHDVARLRRGLVVDGVRTRPAEVHLLETHQARPARERADHATLSITLREGRNRQVRRMCEAIGHPVNRLKRVAIGSITDGRLKPGQCRDLTDAEVRRLRRADATG
jgi:pseudouridine synthase